MAKILISFVGTGGLIHKNNQKGSFLASDRQYKTAIYHLGDESLGKYPFVAAALTQYHNIDKVILLGTVHSMWEEVYRYFGEKNIGKINEDVYCEIAEHCEKATHKSVLSIPHKEEIEKVLGGNSKVMLIRYGITEEEIMDNISIVLGLNNLINTNDEIIVDITHSFRSLPIFIMNLLLYLTNVSSKNLCISHIYYGMLEMLQTLHYAPIVDLNKILELNKWIVGSSAFQKYGNAYQISELLKEGIDTGLASELKQFSDLLNLNHLDRIEKEVEKLKTMKNKEYNNQLPELTVKPVLKDFLKEFGTTKGNPALFQYNLANWQYEKKNYALSLISLSEAILTYACLLAGAEWNNQEDREKVKDTIFSRKSELPANLAVCYHKIRKIRNSVAHSQKTSYSSQGIIEELRKALITAGEYIH